MSSLLKALSLALVASTASLAVPALARQPAMDAEGRIFGNTINDPLPAWKAPSVDRVRQPLPPIPEADSAMPMSRAEMDRIAWDEARADWLAECRQRYGGKGKSTGTVLGGLIGGTAGSAIAGRGNRVIGAVVGGVAGAVAGSAIGASADRRQAGDYCESYLDRYLARYEQAQGQRMANYGYPQGQLAYAMQPMMVMVPVAMTRVATPVVQRQNCQETEVIEEWVPVSRPARRYIPRRVVPDKRVRIAPDKRLRVY